MKDKKVVCDIQSSSAPPILPPKLLISRYDVAAFYPLSVLPNFEICPLGANPSRLAEWKSFLSYLMNRNKVAILMSHDWDLFINPPGHIINNKQSVVVSYRKKVTLQPDSHIPLLPHYLNMITGDAEKVQPFKPMQVFLENKENRSQDGSPRFAKTHPSYMETLGQIHASWIFGAIAELVDNARDAGATRLDVFIEQEYFAARKMSLPVLCVTDNGTGMSHTDTIRMMSFGHSKPSNDDEDLIGRFGVGFKTGSMRLGKDALVFTQSRESRSIAFLSRSFNEGKEEVEIPTVTYKRNQGWMDFDDNIQSQKQAEAHLKAVKDFSPFNEYSIGAKFEAFGDETGTTICIYNLDRWGSEYSLKWDPKLSSDRDSKQKCDIVVRSQRVRARPGQLSREVPLDYSLHAYLEVMFFEPKMKIYVQGSVVNTRRLHKSLSKTKVIKDTVAGKKVELTLGISQEERDRGNCGIFLYWHGRLIEAYKRVGGMVHNADVGRGVIGVIDVTDIMRLQKESVGVLNNKQGFLDCDVYAALEEWLGKVADRYWDDNFDCVEVEEKEVNAVYTPHRAWVQCNKCLKWRMLDESVSSKDLPAEWFCFMPPFKGTCAMAEEEEEEAGVVIIEATRNCESRVSKSIQVKEEEDHSVSGGHSGVSNIECRNGSADVHLKAKTRETTCTSRQTKRESLAQNHSFVSRKAAKAS